MDPESISENRTEYLDACATIKKALIYLIMVLDNLRSFVWIKTEWKRASGLAIDEEVSKRNERKIEEKIREIRRGQGRERRVGRFEVDSKLFCLSMEKLIAKISIADLGLFVKITQVNFKNIKTGNYRNCDEKFGHIELNLNNLEKIESSHSQSNKIVTLKISQTELDTILLARTKRQETKTAYCFNRLRGGLSEAIWGAEQKGTIQKNGEMDKRRLAASYFKLDEEQTKTFLANGDLNGGGNRMVTKADLRRLHEQGQFRKKALEWVNQELIDKEIAGRVTRKKGHSMFDEYKGIVEFVRKMDSGRQKFPWVIQNVLNSIEQYFQVLKARN